MISAAFHAELAWVWNAEFGAGAAYVWAYPNPPGRVAMTSSGGGSCGKDGSADKKDDLVITPGGPRPREQVHPVGPGETVRRNPDGTYTVVPKQTPDSNQRLPERK